MNPSWFLTALIVLSPSSASKIIIGMLDEECPLGKRYSEKTKKSKFYKNAKFYSVNQVLDWLRDFKFGKFKIVQTIFKNPGKIQSLEPIEEGFGKGLFVVISAKNKKSRVANGESTLKAVKNTKDS